MDFTYEPAQKSRKVYYVKTRKPRGPQVEPGRDAGIVASYSSGKTLEEIGIVHGLSRERVRQILVKNGIAATHGGRAVRKKSRQLLEAEVRAMAVAKRDAKIVAELGCTYAEAVQINSGYSPWSKTARRSKAYLHQKRSAKRRGIQWEITFPEWWTFWSDSGRWMQRGRTTGCYVLARNNDVEPYKIGNIKIISNSENISESYYIVSGAVRQSKRSEMAPTKDLRAYHLKMGGLTNSEIAVHLKIASHVTSQYICNGRRAFAAMIAAERPTRKAAA